MASFVVINDDGIDGNGIQFGSLSQIAASGISLSSPPAIAPDSGTITFNDGGVLMVRGTGLGFTAPSTFSGTVDFMAYLDPGPVCVFEGFSLPFADLAAAFIGGTGELAVLAAMFSDNSLIYGSNAADTLIGFGGATMMGGGGGNDTMAGGDSGDLIHGDADNDSLYGRAGMDDLRGDNGNDVLRGGDGGDTLDGGTGNDILEGDAGPDALNGGDGIDTAYYVNSAIAVTVNLATGTGLGGDAAGDTLSNIEQVLGSAFNDTLAGDANANTLQGLGGDDTLTGGGGGDLLKGGAGNDTFVYLATGDSTVAAVGKDVIADFTTGDKIDLSAIDANGAAAGNGTFIFGTGTFTGVAGELRVVTVGGVQLVYADTNGDGQLDFAINVISDHALTAADFTL